MNSTEKRGLEIYFTSLRQINSILQSYDDKIVKKIFLVDWYSFHILSNTVDFNQANLMKSNSDISGVVS